MQTLCRVNSAGSTPDILARALRAQGIVDPIDLSRRHRTRVWPIGIPDPVHGKLRHLHRRAARSDSLTELTPVLIIDLAGVNQSALLGSNDPDIAIRRQPKAEVA